MSAQELPFAQALQKMVEQNVNVQIQETKVEASRAQVNAARGTFTPQIFLEAQQNKLGGNAPSAAGVSPYATSQIYTANATWNIFRSGSDAALVRSATNDRAVQLATLDDATLQAEDQAARALITLIGKLQIVEALRRSEQSVHHFLEIAQARYARSLLSREESDKVLIDAANAEAKRADAELEANGARAEVTSLLGHSRVGTTWPWETEFTSARAQELLNEKDPTKALEARPDYQADKAAIEREDSRSRSLFRLMLPSIDLNYSVGDTRTGGQSVTGWSSLATLTVPLWSGLRDYSNYRVQVENKYAAERQMQQLQRDVQSRVEVAQANFALSLKQYTERLRTVKVAQHILDQDGARFKVGRADANELNLDLTRVTAAEILAIQGIEQIHIAYLTLLHSFGRRI